MWAKNNVKDWTLNPPKKISNKMWAKNNVKDWTLNPPKKISNKHEKK